MPTVLTRTCRDCGGEFQQQRVGPGQPRRRCDRCEALHALPKVGQIDVRDCIRCGDPFEQINRGAHPFLLCEPCRAESAADNDKRKKQKVVDDQIAGGFLVRRLCEDCKREFVSRTAAERRHCPPCRGVHSRARRAEREAERRAARVKQPILVHHGMKSIVGQAPNAAAWYAHLREQILQWDEAFRTPLEMYALTMARIESGYRWTEDQRDQGASMKDLLTAEAQLDTQLRIAIKLAHELGLTPRSAISMAKDAGTAHELRRRSAIDRVNQHLLESDAQRLLGDGEAA